MQAFVRENNGKKVVIITNLSKLPQSVVINNAIIDGEATELFTHKKETLKSGKTITLPAWGYLVYQY